VGWLELCLCRREQFLCEGRLCLRISVHLIAPGTTTGILHVQTDFVFNIFVLLLKIRRAEFCVNDKKFSGIDSDLVLYLAKIWRRNFTCLEMHYLSVDSMASK
jgi:hypothetical protein